MLALVALVPVERLVATRRRDVVRALVGAVALVAVAGALGLVASVGNPFTWAADQIGGSGEVVNDPGRLGSLETNNRTVWWGEAWQVFRAHPAGGTGARTFEIARKRYRDDAANVTEPHSLPLQLLSDTGLPALLLGLTLVVGLGLGLRATVRRLEPGERAAAVGLVALPLAFGLHSLVDYDLDFLAVAAPTALVSGALLAAGRPSAIVRSRAIVTAGAVVGALVAVWVLAAPELSARSVARAYRQVDARRSRRRGGVGPAGPEPESALARAALRAGDRRVQRGRQRRRGAVLRAGDPAPAGEPRHLVGARLLPADRAREPVQRVLRPQRRLHPRSEEQPGSRRTARWRWRRPRSTIRSIRPAGRSGRRPRNPGRG